MFNNLKLTKPRAVWLMVPAGTPTEETIEHLRPFLESGDTIIDGGNSFYKDDVRRSDALKKQGIHYLDAGTSGGVWGIERGYCLMIGGDEAAAKRLEPIFKSLAPSQGDDAPSPGRENIKSTAEKGFLYCGPSGAGHFVKMIHNGIEYGVMQAYAEAFDILRGAGSDELTEGYRYDFNADIAELWAPGRSIHLPKRCFRPCAISSVATSKFIQETDLYGSMSYSSGGRPPAPL